MSRRPWISVVVAALMLTGCALPSLPKLPKLPALPKLPSLPKLPKLSDAAKVLPVGSEGESLKDAYALAMPLAEAWGAGAAPVQVMGMTLDPGGRNGGHETGAWVIWFQSEAEGLEKLWLEVRVVNGEAKQRPMQRGAALAPMARDLTGILDSTEAMAKAGLSGNTFTMIVRQEGEAVVYNILQADGLARAVLDARTGVKDPQRST